jgi:formiminotetrahydrofolate cyclodeaminase
MNENIEAFLRVLDPVDNSTGGGTASALAGAMAAALVAMVARLSIGKEGLEAEAFYRELGAEAQVLSDELLDGGREDSQAFMDVRAAYKLPKQTDEQKTWSVAGAFWSWACSCEGARTPTPPQTWNVRCIWPAPGC